jgi:NADH-quinone oxidoreductase subunit L
MTVPLMILAALSMIGGFVGFPAWLGSNAFEHFLEPSQSLSLAHIVQYEEQSHAAEMAFAGISVAVALLGIFLAHRLYVQTPQLAGVLAARFRGLYSVLFRKYYVDEAYDALIVNPAVTGSKELLWKWFDMGVVDGTVNGVGKSVQAWAGLLKNIQNGLIRSYAAWILIGAVAVLMYIALAR